MTSSPGNTPYEELRRIDTSGVPERINRVQEQREREERDKLIIHEARKGRTPQQIARYTGTSKQTVIRVLRLAGIKPVSRGTRP